MSNFLDYEIVLQAVETKEMYHDVQFCSFIKQPIEKNSSYCLIKLNLTDIILQQIKNDISVSNYPRFNLMIFLINDNKRTTVLYEKSFQVLFINPDEEDVTIKDRVSCRLLLVNPLLHYMSTTNAFNRILNNKTAYDIILKYEEFVIKQYGNSFSRNHIGVKKQKNEHLYEQILIKTENDLKVPTDIINKYKPFNSFNFYFFDDFNFSENNKYDICMNYINLSNKNLFNKFDIYEFPDLVQGMRKIKTTPVSDFFSIIHKEMQTQNVHTKEIRYKTDKKITAFIPTQKTIMSIPTEVNEYRNIAHSINTNLTSTNNKKKIQQSIEYTDIYAPDNMDNTNARFKNAKELFDEKIKNITEYYCPNAIPDAIQLGNLYNFGIAKEFIFTPFNIVSIFFRKNIREHLLSHIVKFNCFEFYS